MIEFRVLTYFLAVAEERSVTRAAEAVHTSQPNLSRQLLELERTLGCRLFERGKTAVLTEAGELLKRRAAEILSLVSKTESELSFNAKAVRGTISVGFGEMKCVQNMADCAAAFRQTYPGVNFEFFTGTADQVKERMEKGLLDAGLLLEPIEIEKYDFFRLPEKTRFVAVMQSSCPLAQKESATADDLAQFPLIFPVRANIRNELASWFAEYFPNLRISAVNNLSTNAALLVLSGMGIAIGSEGHAFPEGCEEKFAVRPLEPEVSFSAVVAWKKSRACSPLLEEFIRFAKEFLLREKTLR
ncbi:MAG: LysR family transcriptional regulator [Bacteroides sp.]|nr:LysR family transcriptional regulator [Prevotella sp.]MCM1406928.1 LysR family transcriptional regulator [Treponema brennaborense]MCM1470079.1 LysR family transcriptional regulator [Bacteroides sp.]